MEVTTAEQLKKYIGQEIGVGRWVAVTQEMVNKFADATGDRQYIHVDPERAKGTPFGGTIVHGFYTLSMLGGFLIEEQQGLEINLGGDMFINYGLNKVRFVAPVPVGKSLRLHNVLQAVEEDSNKKWLQMVFQQTVELEGSERPALVAEFILRTYTGRHLSEIGE